jgi:hypothetical protein
MPKCPLVATVVFRLATIQDETDMLHQVPDDSISQPCRDGELYVSSFYLRSFCITTILIIVTLIRNSVYNLRNRHNTQRQMYKYCTIQGKEFRIARSD